MKKLIGLCILLMALPVFSNQVAEIRLLMVDSGAHKNEFKWNEARRDLEMITYGQQLTVSSSIENQYLVNMGMMEPPILMNQWELPSGCRLLSAHTNYSRVNNPMKMKITFRGKSCKSLMDSLPGYELVFRFSNVRTGTNRNIGTVEVKLEY